MSRASHLKLYARVGRDMRDPRLTARDRVQIQALRLCGVTIKELAIQFGSTCLVSSKLCGRYSPTQK